MMERSPHSQSPAERPRLGSGWLHVPGKASLGLRPMDTGPLLMARTLEHVCLLSLGLLKHSVKHTNFAIGVNLLG
jgi:hypothetical protein